MDLRNLDILLFCLLKFKKCIGVTSIKDQLSIWSMQHMIRERPGWALL